MTELEKENLKLKDTIKKLRKRISKMKKKEQEAWDLDADEPLNTVSLENLPFMVSIDKRCPKCNKTLEVIELPFHNLLYCTCGWRKSE